MPFAPLEISAGHTLYRVCARRDAPTGQGRVLCGSTAERVIAQLLRSEHGAAVRHAFARLTQSVGTAHASDGAVLHWFARALGGELGRFGSGHLVLLELRASARGERPRSAPPTPAQTLLTELQTRRVADLQVSGHSYRLAIGGQQAELPGRALFEAVSPKEARALLETASTEPRYESQRALLGAALAFLEPQTDPYAQLVLLRRQRQYVRENDESKPLTPSQIREENESHWIEFRVVDDKGAPYANESFTLKLPNGETRSGTTDENGIAHVKSSVGGDCELSFPKLKHKSGPSKAA